jgi:hypothetical protein
LGGALYAVPNFECRYDMIWCDVVIVVLFYMGIPQPVPLIKISQNLGRRTPDPMPMQKVTLAGAEETTGVEPPAHSRTPARPNAALLKPTI